MSSSESQKSENAFDLKVKEYEALDAWTAISDVTRLPAYKWNNWMWSKIMTDSQIMHRRSVFFSTKLRQTVVLMINQKKTVEMGKQEMSVKGPNK